MADMCPDCGRERPEHYWDDPDVFCFATGTVNDCQPRTITRLRARVAELEQAHAEQVAEREHLEEGARLCMLAWPLLDAPIFEDERDALALFFDAERARQAKGAKREGGG